MLLKNPVQSLFSTQLRSFHNFPIFFSNNKFFIHYILKFKQTICTVKYTDDLMLLARKKVVLRGMIDRLTEVVRCYRMEINVEEANIMSSMDLLPVRLTRDQK